MATNYNDPYRPAMSPPQPSGGGGMSVLWIVLGAVAGLVLVCGCCGGGCTWFTFWGMDNIAGDTLARELRQSDKFREHCGEVESCHWNVLESGEAESQYPEDEMIFAFDVEGSQGSGLVIGSFSEDLTEVYWAKLRLPSGELVDVVTHEPLAAP